MREPPAATTLFTGGSQLLKDISHCSLFFRNGVDQAIDIRILPGPAYPVLPLGYLIGYAGHPYISDDGNSLFFTGQSGSDTDIYKVSLEGILTQYSKFLLLIKSENSEVYAKTQIDELILK